MFISIILAAYTICNMCSIWVSYESRVSQDKPVHPHKLQISCAGLYKVIKSLMASSVERGAPQQTVRIRWLVLSFACRIWHKTNFRITRLFCISFIKNQYERKTKMIICWKWMFFHLIIDTNLISLGCYCYQIFISNCNSLWLPITDVCVSLGLFVRHVNFQGKLNIISI